MRFLIGLALAAVAVTLARGAVADSEQGRRLFDEGKAAMASRNFAEACGKFEASFAASSVPGSLLNWADCEEQRGRLATALELWQRGEKLVVGNQERTDFVRSRIQALEHRVPRLTVKVAAGAVAATVTVDGRAASTDAPIALDPGAHDIEVSASGLAPEKKRVELTPGESEEVLFFEGVAAPRPEPRPQPPPRPIAPRDEGGQTLVVAGWVVGSIGLAGLAAFGVTAGLVYDACHGTLDPCGGTQGRDADQVKALNIANATTLGVGIAALGAGAVLLGVGYSPSSSDDADTSEMTFRVGPGSAEIGWRF